MLKGAALTWGKDDTYHHLEDISPSVIPLSPLHSTGSDPDETPKSDSEHVNVLTGREVKDGLQAQDELDTAVGTTR